MCSSTFCQGEDAVKGVGGVVNNPGGLTDVVFVVGGVDGG